MLDVFYYIIIYPLQLIIEILFYTFYDADLGIGLTIFIVSLFVNLGSLPMFLSAYKLQKKERDIQEKLAPKVKSIKANFKGSERFMMLSTYYKQNNYHPIMSLRISLSLLLEIPFFVAAYLFFSHLDILTGLNWWIIKDLSLPDGLLKINNLSINFLPILMTVFNIISCEIYMKDFKFKEKAQIYVLALVFLVILYNSPSGLVLYWTFNNLISLIRNFIMKLKKESIKKYIFCVMVLSCILYFLINKYHFFLDVKIVFLMVLYLLLMFFIWKDIKKREDNNIQKEEKYIFLLTCIITCLFIGLIIPTGIISNDIVYLFSNTKNPILQYFYYPLLQCLGFFVFFPILFYYFANNKIKIILLYVFVIFLFCGVLNYILVDVKFRNITADFEIISLDFLNKNSCLKNLFYDFFVACLAVFLIYKKKYKFILKMFIILFITFFVLIINFTVVYVKNNKRFNHIEQYSCDEEKKIHLSKTKKNVIVFILDAATGYSVPKIFEEKKELKQIYDGFVYYPNTLSSFNQTNLGLPPILGGYEYLALNLESREDKYKDKLLEGVFVLPVMFRKNDWDVTFTDLYYNVEFPMTELFDGEPGEFYLKKYNIKMERIMPHRHPFDKNNIYFSRLFLLFSMSLSLPGVLKKELYSDIKYLNKKSYNHQEGLRWFAKLRNVVKCTDFNNEKDSFVVIYNTICHHLAVFDENNTFSIPVNKKDKLSIIDRDYYSDFSAFSLIGNFLEYLKQNDVYNNTRIIMVSDHGSVFNNEQRRSVVPILLVKDFNAKGECVTDISFMTNADVPLMATKNLFNQINPFTLKKLETQKKEGFYIPLVCLESTLFWYNKSTIFKDEDDFLYIENKINKEKTTNMLLKEEPEHIFYKEILDKRNKYAKKNLSLS